MIHAWEMTRCCVSLLNKAIDALCSRLEAKSAKALDDQ